MVRVGMVNRFSSHRQRLVKVGLTYLKTEIADYWAQRENLAGVLRFSGRLPMSHWEIDAEAGGLLAGALEKDHV